MAHTTLKELLEEKHNISKKQMFEKARVDKAANERMKLIDRQIEEALEEELHAYWENHIKPSINQLLGKMKAGLDLFSDYQEQFENHVRSKKSEVVDDKLLAEIYGATLARQKDKSTAENSPE